MSKIFRVIDEEEGYMYNQRTPDEKMLEKAFKEGCEHGYKKAMREMGGYNERSHNSYNEGFEEKIERLRKKYE